MQAMQLLASSGVTMATGAMVSLSFAVSQPLTLPPPRPVPVDASGNLTAQQHRTSETVGAAITDTFARRWQATDDMPLKPVPRRDPLEGLIGGLLTQPLAHDAPQGMQVESSPSIRSRWCRRSRQRRHPTSVPDKACIESITRKTITATGAAHIVASDMLSKKTSERSTGAPTSYTRKAFAAYGAGRFPNDFSTFNL